MRFKAGGFLCGNADDLIEHIKALETWGLIRTHKIGRVRVCSLEPQALDLLHEWVNYWRSRWERRKRQV